MRVANVVGVGMTPFGRHADRSLGDLARSAVSAALADADIPTTDVGLVVFANSMAGLISGQESIRGQVSLSGSGLDGAPMVNVENACASGATAVHLAAMAVAGGQCEVALAVGAEKLYHEDKLRTFQALESALDIAQVDEIRARLGADGEDAAKRSVFMDYYVDVARRYSERSGATQRDFAQVAVKSREFAARNERAQFRTTVTLDEVLASRIVADPLTLMMCSPIGDGAAAVLVASEEKACELATPSVRILATELRSGEAGTRGKTIPAAIAAAYEAAGVGPEDLDVVECHDAAAPAELLLYEELGLSARGDGIALLWSGETALGGRIPVNPSGGLLSKGHPVAASGCAQVVELTEQLRGGAGERQVEGASIALAENAGGLLDPDVAACAVTVLAR